MSEQIISLDCLLAQTSKNSVKFSNGDNWQILRISAGIFDNAGVGSLLVAPCVVDQAQKEQTEDL